MKKYIIGFCHLFDLNYEANISDDYQIEDDSYYIDNYKDLFHIQVDSINDSYGNVVVVNPDKTYKFYYDRTTPFNLIQDIIKHIIKFEKLQKKILEMV